VLATSGLLAALAASVRVAQVRPSLVRAAVLLAPMEAAVAAAQQLPVVLAAAVPMEVLLAARPLVAPTALASE